MISKIMQGKPKFITIDGLDGAGKGTQVKKLAGYLFDKDKSNHVAETREPFKSKFMRQIRKILKDSQDPKSLKKLLTKLFISDRKVHVWVIKRLLKMGITVISDRYKYSTLAYQWAQGMDLKKLIKAHKGILVPDLTVILDVPAEVSLKRISKAIKGGKRHKEVFDKLEFQNQVRKNFLALPKYLPKEKIVIVNGNQPKEKVFAAIKKAVDKVL